MIVTIAIRRRFIGFMLALIVFYGLFSELTIFYLAYRRFLISHEANKKEKESESRPRRAHFPLAVARLDALCATRMKFMASNMRFHTTECFRCLQNCTLQHFLPSPGMVREARRKFIYAIEAL